MYAFTSPVATVGRRILAAHTYYTISFRLTAKQQHFCIYYPQFVLSIANDLLYTPHRRARAPYTYIPTNISEASEIICSTKSGKHKRLESNTENHKQTHYE